MPKKAKALVMGLFLALVGVACVAMFAGKAHAEDDDWEPGDPYPPVSGNGWSISEDGTMTVVSDAGWQDYLANGPGEWIWEYDEFTMDERVQKLVIGKNVTTLSIYDPKRWNIDSMQDADYQIIDASGIYKPYVSIDMQAPKCMPPEIEVEEGNHVFSVENGLLINNVKKSIVLSEIDVSDVVIPDGIREIEAWAFYYRNITSVVFPKSLETIGAAAFSNCNNLTEVGLPNTVTRLDACAFARCYSLNKVTISSGLKTIEALVFRGCPLKKVTIPEGIQTIGFMAFEDCDDLERISLPETLTKIDNYAFSGCKILEEVNLPSNLAYIGYRAFENCESWEIIQLPNSLTTIGEEAFFGCEPTLLQLPEKLTVNAVPLEERGWRSDFSEDEPSTRLLGFDYVETLIISGTQYSTGNYLVKSANQVVFLYKPPADWRQITTKVYSQIVYYLDQYASDWKTIDLTVWNGLSRQQLTRNQVTEIILTTQRQVDEGYISVIPDESAGLPEVAPVEVFDFYGWSMSSDGVLTIQSNEGWLNWLRQDKFINPSKLVIGKDVTELTLFDLSETVPISGFYRPEDIIGYAEDGSAVYSYARSSYFNPKKIDLDAANKSFSYGDGMLVNLGKNEIVLSDWSLSPNAVIPEGIRSIGNGAFREKHLNSIQLPSTLETIGVEAFALCGLKHLDLPNSVTSIGKFAFRDCGLLKNIKLSERLNKIEEGTFLQSRLDQIVLPDGIREIEKDAFAQCLNLKHVQLSKSLRKIGPSAFQDCGVLEYVWFSDQIESIGPEAFCGCELLKEVVLPDSLEAIGLNAFQECELTLLRIPPELHIYEFDWDRQTFKSDIMEEDVSLRLESVGTIIFSGNNYDLGEPAFDSAENVYFQSRPPENVGDFLPENKTGSIFCSETNQQDWIVPSIASWVRNKIEFVPATKIDNWVDSLLRATPMPTIDPDTIQLVNTPKPTATPRPTASPTPTTEPEKQTADPIIILLIVFIVLVIAAVVLLILKPWVKKKKRNKKRRTVAGLPAGTPTPNETPETENADKLE